MKWNMIGTVLLVLAALTASAMAYPYAAKVNGFTVTWEESSGTVYHKVVPPSAGSSSAWLLIGDQVSLPGWATQTEVLIAPCNDPDNMKNIVLIKLASFTGDDSKKMPMGYFTLISGRGGYADSARLSDGHYYSVAMVPLDDGMGAMITTVDNQDQFSDTMNSIQFDKS